MDYRTLEEIKKDIENIKVEIDNEFKKQNNKERNGENFDYSLFHKLCRKEDELKREQDIVERYNVKVGDGVTINYYSDSHACTIIARTKTTLTIQQDKATLNKDWKPEIIPGGFVGHCVNNNTQEYNYERNEKGRIFKAHWSKTKGKFIVDKCLTVSNGRHEFYDYNF